MSPINFSNNKYNPDNIPEQEFLANFVIRHHEFNEIFDDIKESNFNTPSQHFVIVGQRGQGKTSLLRKIKLAVNADKKLSRFLLPIKFVEEQYGVRTLSRLWEVTAEYLQDNYPEDFPDLLAQIEQHIDDDDYDLLSFSYLEKAVNAKKKKVLLLIDNIDAILGKLSKKEHHQLREILLTSSLFKIIGGSTKMLEQHYDYSHPFYEFFNILTLNGLNQQECVDFLTCMVAEPQQDKIKAIIKHAPERIETLRRLTGGVPRTLIMLIDIFLDDDDNTYNDLVKVLDDVTTLYQHRMDSLPDTLQDITNTIALHWDGITTKEIAKKTRIASKVVSAQLNQLENKYRVIESTAVGKNKIYKITDRFFNIWYLMRYGRKRDKQKVEWLVNFLNSWCDKSELENRAKRFINTMKQGKLNDSYVYHMAETLGYAGISSDIEHKVKQQAKEYLVDKKSSYANDLSPSDKELLTQARESYNNKNFAKAIVQLLKVKQKGGSILNFLADAYEEDTQFEQAEGYYLQAIKAGDTDAQCNIALMYKQQGKLEQAEDYYLKAIEAVNTNALFGLAFMYKQQEKLEQAEDYYLQAIDAGNTDALVNLANLYSDQEKFQQAESYYLQAIEAGDTKAINNLAWEYFEQGIKREQALKLITLAFSKDPHVINTINYAIILLWSEEISNSYDLFLQWLQDYQNDIFNNKEYDFTDDISLYLLLLMAKKQLHKTKQLMELPEYQFKDKYKPIWYALMTLLEAEFPQEIQKMGSELQESVNEILAKINSLSEKYALE